MVANWRHPPRQKILLDSILSNAAALGINRQLSHACRHFETTLQQIRAVFVHLPHKPRPDLKRQSGTLKSFGNFKFWVIIIETNPYYDHESWSKADKPEIMVTGP